MTEHVHGTLGGSQGFYAVPCSCEFVATGATLREVEIAWSRHCLAAFDADRRERALARTAVHTSATPEGRGGCAPGV
ncbi:MAG TPA: hypothetical protein VMR97_07845 [Acidimicrobiales bacterium]|nr:hypothetical protein [Acidimicrobiales bacterium]